MAAEAERWADVGKVVGRAGPLAGVGYEAGPEGLQRLAAARVLVVGAGGLGCELLKDLALSGFRALHVIDMDVIEYSNLNRQFLFRATDVKKPKAVAAAEFINKRVRGANVTPYVGMLQSMPREWYKQFELIVSGLDSVPARRWLNFTLCGLVEKDADGELVASTIIPLIDGGTEGFKGHVRVILPYLSACFECAIDAFPPQTKYPICTIASEPRLPEHCVEWASEIAWKSPDYPKPFAPGTKLDADNAEHMRWVCETAQARAADKGIAGVTLRLAMGVVKNIVPAIAATNALVAAACANEAFKYVTSASQGLDNYMMYNGASGAYTYTFVYERKGTCLACGVPSATYTVRAGATLEELMQQLAADPHFQFQAPSVRMAGRNLYMQAPEALRLATAANLGRTLAELGVAHGTDLSVSDPVLPVGLVLRVEYSS
eukprot:m51a1_g4699 putative ubiquitin-activating enzyme e1c (433) ;mRNA; r:225940-228536